MRKWLIVLALAFPAFAAKTTVTDVLVKTTGGFCSGIISIQNPAFTSIDGPIAAATVTTNINATTGRFTINLEPGPYYTATYVVAPSGCTPTVEFWSVPISATPVDLAMVRSVAPPPPLPNTIPLSYITQSGAVLNDCAKWNGTNWAPASSCGGGGGSSLTVGTTTIISGTTARILYDNAGILGEYPITGNGNVVLSNGPTLTLTNATLLPVSTGISGLGTGVATSLGLAVSGSGAICLVTSSSCSGNGTVVGAGSLTNTALVTGGGAQTILTPSATATLDTSGNISTPGSISAGVGSGVAGTFECTQGTAPSLGTTSIKVYCPTSVTSYAFVLPVAAATGILHAANAANIDTLSISAVSLTADITGTLAAGNGGTGITSLGTGVATALGTAVSGTGAICLASGSACSGGATNLTIGTSTITSGTTTRVLLDNAGVVGEYVISGSGNVCMTTSCSMTTPVLGTPTSGTLSNTTGFPAANLAGLGTGVATALAANVSGTGAICLASGSACAGSGGNYVQLATNTLGSPAASVSFTSISGSYKNLYLVIEARCSSSTDQQGVTVTVNTDATSVYSRNFFVSNNGSGASGQNNGVGPGTAPPFVIPCGTALANAGGAGELWIPNYAGTTFSKQGNVRLSYMSGATANTGTVGIMYWLWNSTAAITRLDLTVVDASNFITGSTFTLYGTN